MSQPVHDDLNTTLISYARERLARVGLPLDQAGAPLLLSDEELVDLAVAQTKAALQWLEAAQKAAAAVVVAAVAYYDAPVGPQRDVMKALMDAVAAYKAVTA